MPSFLVEISWHGILLPSHAIQLQYLVLKGMFPIYVTFLNNPILQYACSHKTDDESQAMSACDNRSCKSKWFHFQSVGPSRGRGLG